MPRVVWLSSHQRHSVGAGTVVAAASCGLGRGQFRHCVNTTNTSDQAKSNVSVLAPTSVDLGVLAEVLGEAFGDLDVDLRSAGFEVWGGVPGSDADFSVSFCKKKHSWRYSALTHLKLYPGWVYQPQKIPKLTFEVEDSEFLCLRRLDWRCCFWPSAVSPVVWGPSEPSVCVTSPCSGLFSGAACWSFSAW